MLLAIIASHDYSIWHIASPGEQTWLCWPRWAARRHGLGSVRLGPVGTDGRYRPTRLGRMRSCGFAKHELRKSQCRVPRRNERGFRFAPAGHACKKAPKPPSFWAISLRGHSEREADFILNSARFNLNSFQSHRWCVCGRDSTRGTTGQPRGAT